MLPPHTHLLDVGCADGFQSEFLAKALGAKEYLGVDVSRNAIERARRLCAHLRQLSFKVGDIRTHDDDLTSRFDVVYVGRTLYYVAPEIDLALDNIESYLKRPGLFVYTYNEPRNAFSSRWLTIDGLEQKLLSRNWSLHSKINIRDNEHEVFEIGAYLVE